MGRDVAFFAGPADDATPLSLFVDSVFCSSPANFMSPSFYMSPLRERDDPQVAANVTLSVIVNERQPASLPCP